MSAEGSLKFTRSGPLFEYKRTKRIQSNLIPLEKIEWKRHRLPRDRYCFVCEASKKLKRLKLPKPSILLKEEEMLEMLGVHFTESPNLYYYPDTGCLSVRWIIRIIGDELNRLSQSGVRVIQRYKRWRPSS